MVNNIVKIFFLNDNGQVLLMRKKDKVGLWHLWSISFKDSEIIGDVIINKVYEELNIKLKKDDLKLIAKKEKMDVINNLYFYYVKIGLDKKLILKNGLLEEKWFKIDELLKLAQYKDNSIEFDKNSLSLLKKIRRISNIYNRNFM